jgi:hypothetical protein
VPARFAPYPAELPANADEVSEEDSPVEILAPAEAVLHTPNRISLADFQGWVEQRGSKFFRSWDGAYTPIIATHDKGQEPQKGGWLTARYGKGHYTYFAYALHRQLPYGVPGAYRLLANLLSLGRAAAEAGRPARAPRGARELRPWLDWRSVGAPPSPRDILCSWHRSCCCSSSPVTRPPRRRPT